METLPSLSGSDLVPDRDEVQRERVWRDELLSVPDMKEVAIELQSRDLAGSLLLAGSLRTIPGDTTAILNDRLTRTERLLTIWAIHVELDRRGVPPCLRNRVPHDSPQHKFLEVLADLRWLATRYPHHQVQHERTRGVFRYEPTSDQWHRAALWVYRGSRGITHFLAKRLGLTDQHRALTMTMPTKQQLAGRRTLMSHIGGIKSAIRRHAIQHPDKTGAVGADEIADRRALLIRVHVLLGRSQAATLHYMTAVMGQAMTRQTLKRQLDAGARAGGAEHLVFGN